MLISERSSADSLSLIVSPLTNRSLPDFGGKYGRYCKDTQSIPVQSPLNPDVRCFIIKTPKTFSPLFAVLRDWDEERDGTGWSHS